MSRRDLIDAGFGFLLGVTIACAGFNPLTPEFVLVLIVLAAWCAAAYVQGRRS